MSLNWKCGHSSAARSITKNTFELYAQAGIDCMEVSCGLIEDNDFIDPVALKKWSHDSSIELWSYHVPFAPFESMNLASLDSSLRKSSVELVKKMLDTAFRLEVKTAVIHASAEPFSDDRRKEAIENAKESLFAIAEYAKANGVFVAVEDLPRTCIGNCSADILELISAHELLRVCFDTNHLLTESGVDFINACGNKIITTHVSDYDFLNERHWLPYEGKNDWVGIVSALEAVGYDGPFLFEIGLSPSATIDRRMLTYNDFYACYKACISKQRFEPVGTPRLDECLKNSFYKTPVIK